MADTQATATTLPVQQDEVASTPVNPPKKPRRKPGDISPERQVKLLQARIAELEETINKDRVDFRTRSEQVMKVYQTHAEKQSAEIAKLTQSNELLRSCINIIDNATGIMRGVK